MPTVNTEEKYLHHWNLKPDDYNRFVVTLIHLVYHRIRYSPIIELFSSSGLILVDKKAGKCGRAEISLLPFKSAPTNHVQFPWDHFISENEVILLFLNKWGKNNARDMIYYPNFKFTLTLQD